MKQADVSTAEPFGAGPAELVSIQDFIRWGASRFNEAGLCFGHGTDNALDEAAALVLHALHLDHSLPDRFRDCRLTPPERDRVVQLLERRVRERKPLAYLTHRALFAGCEFYVDERVLVPRSPLAEVIERGFAPWVDPEGVRRILDLGTGCGCIGLAAALHLPGASVDLVDVSPAALAVAEHNIARHGLADRVRLFEGDLFSGLGSQRYDLIVSNPPYVASDELETLPREYQAEPRLGLAGGETGLDVVSAILREASEHLEPEGVLIVECGDAAERLARRFPAMPFTWLEFERGGEGVFVLTREQLLDGAASLAELA